MSNCLSLPSTAPVLRYQTAVDPVARERQERARRQLWAPEACYRAAIRPMPEADVREILATWEK
ncbi:hypothetical protein [Stenotrophomonas acidaminiphila]|uniref:hypothetical protein n=1 Tax=Stenotrophomonas acidaminiphila TaxID=128780 RepID=UPI0020C5CAFA|nr:hypothetical protein [Stenotrophomonas acidaminiphila]